MLLEGSQERLFNVVSDYDRYHEWMPMIDSSKVLAQEGDVTIAEFRVPQWSDRNLTLELVHARPNSIAFRQIDGMEPPAISGRWQLEDAETGVLVAAHLRVHTPLLHFGSRRRINTELQVTLDALGTRHRKLSSGRAEKSIARQKVLEVVREAGGLKIWYMGESFLVPKVQEQRRK